MNFFVLTKGNVMPLDLHDEVYFKGVGIINKEIRGIIEEKNTTFDSSRDIIVDYHVRWYNGNRGTYKEENLEKIDKPKGNNMVHYSFKPDISYPQDVERIQKICFLHGVNLSPSDCNNLWKDYSRMRAVGWLCLPEDDKELWNAICTMSDRIVGVDSSYFIKENEE